METIPKSKGKFAERVIERDNAIAMNQYSLAGLSRYSTISFHGMLFDSAIRTLAYMKALTFEDEKSTGNIYRAATPLDAGRLAGDVANCQPGEWEELMPAKLRQVCELKFAPRKGSNRFYKWLLETGDKYLIYCSSWEADDCFSCGLNVDDPDVFVEDKHRAPNLLGQTLMEVRAQLRENLRRVDDGETNEDATEDAGPPKKLKCRRANNKPSENPM